MSDKKQIRELGKCCKTLKERIRDIKKKIDAIDFELSDILHQFSSDADHHFDEFDEDCFGCKNDPCTCCLSCNSDPCICEKEI